MLHIPIEPVAALIAGLLIFLMPHLLNYIVASYLVVIGLVGLFGAYPLPVRPVESRLDELMQPAAIHEPAPPFPVTDT